jgi:tetratricopeptide (TPR) repeat protein
MTSNAAPTAAARSRARPRVVRAPRQLWQVPTFLAGVLALGLVAANCALRPCRPSPVARDLAGARRVLQDPRSKVEAARSLAEKALAFAGDDDPAQAEAHFLLALAAARQADESPAERAAELRQEALSHSEQAEARGLAEADLPRLCFMQGRVLLLTGADPVRAAGCLSRGLPRGTDDPGAGYGLLVQACLRQPLPDLEGALQANQKQLDYTTDAKQQAAARLSRGEILMRQEHYADALKVLERVGDAAPTEIRQHALSLQARCCEKAGLFGKAAPLWQKLLETPDLVPGGKAHILYTLGRCHLQADPPDPEAARKAWRLAVPEGGAEGQAAAFRLAELDLAALAPDLAQVATDLQQAVGKMAGPLAYQNPLVDIDKARAIFEVAMKVALDTQAYDRGQDLAELYRNVAVAGAADERFAVVSEAWARQLDLEARRSGDETAAVRLRANAQARWRQAAAAVERAAAVQGGEAAGALWRAMQMHRRGLDHDKTAAVLERLVRLPWPPERQAEAWLALAQARTALGRKDEARAALVACTNFSGSRFSYQARYLLALDAQARGQPAEAIKILDQNLEVIRPELDRVTYERSVYKLAALLFQARSYDKAWVRLKQAVTSFPNNPEALASRDRLGECYRKLAEQELQRVREVTEPGNPGAGNRTAAQAHYESQRQDWLEKAADTYQKIRDELKFRSAVNPLAPLEDTLLRKAALALPDIEYDRNNFPEALHLYMELARAYPTQRESLDACEGMGKCLTVLRKSAPDMVRDLVRTVLPEIQGIVRDVRANLEQTRIADAELPPHTTREELQAWLGRVSAYLDRTMKELTP